MFGRNGEDLVVLVPIGTLVQDTDHGQFRWLISTNRVHESSSHVADAVDVATGN